LVSWYALIDEAKKNLSFFKRFKKKPFRSELWNYAIRNSHDFESFLENCTATVFDLGCHKSFIFNQADYLTDKNGNIVVDFIGRFENLAADTDHVFRTLNMKSVSLPKLNQSQHSHYSQWYNAKTRQLIEERFARDIALFGYQFEQR
jgi:chondroitin 4-sulfotransferase 11